MRRLAVSFLRRPRTPLCLSEASIVARRSAMSQASITSFFARSASTPSGRGAGDRAKAIVDDDDSPIKQKKKNKRFRLPSDSDPETSPIKKKVSLNSAEKCEKNSDKISVVSSPESTVKNSYDPLAKKSIDSAAPADTIREAKGKPDPQKADNEKKVDGKKPNIFNVKKKLSEDGQNAERKLGQYNPNKENYHPINDAIWSKNEKVPYLALAKTLEEIEKISARLKIVDMLSNFFRSVIILTPGDLLPSVYLCLNKLAPAYESVELGVAETTLMKAIAQSTGRSLQQIKSDCNSTGDLGLVAERSRSNQKMMIQPSPLTIRGVFEKLKDIAQMTGNAVMSKKVDKIQSIFVACRHSESRYIIRSLAGKLRVGLAEQSVLQALAVACATTPPCGDTDDSLRILNAAKGLSSEQFKAIVDEQALILKTAYCECPNYDLAIPAILKYGIKELPSHCKLSPGVPLKPMLAHPTKGIHEVLHRFENVEFTCEWKYDGERAQIHIPSMKVDGNILPDFEHASIYSRNQENNTSKYPDVLKRLKNILKPSVNSCVLDCEVVAWDKEKEQILPFQILSTRKRKDAKDADIKVSVCVFMFDLLYLNGEPLVKSPFEERRGLLRENFIEITGEWHLVTSLDCNATESIQEFLEESIRGNCEGLMIKTLKGKDASYEIARRSRNWLKLKKDYIEGIGDTIDAVVLGGYLGRGKRAGLYGGFLLGCYDKDSEEYQTLCKIGTGFSDEDLQTHSSSLKSHIIDGPRNYYRYDQSLEPDHWFAPTFVWEIKCGDLSLSPVHKAGVGIVDPEKGISLRFPRFIRVRDDKTPEDATSSHQIAELYSNQDQVKNQKGGKMIEEDFY